MDELKIKSASDIINESEDECAEKAETLPEVLAPNPVMDSLISEIVSSNVDERKRQELLQKQRDAVESKFIKNIDKIEDALNQTIDKIMPDVDSMLPGRKLDLINTLSNISKDRMLIEKQLHPDQMKRQNFQGTAIQINTGQQIAEANNNNQTYNSNSLAINDEVASLMEAMALTKNFLNKDSSPNKLTRDSDDK